MKTWKEDNMLKGLREYTEDGFYEDDDRIIDVYAEGIRDTLKSEYEYIQQLLEDSELDFYDDSSDDFNVLAYETENSTYKFYFDLETDKIDHITETEFDESESGIWHIDDFDIVDTPRGRVFRVITNYSDGDSIADTTIPLYK